MLIIFISKRKLMESKVTLTSYKKADTVTEPEDNEDDNEQEKPTLQTQFTAFVKFRSLNDPGTQILLSQSDFWMKQAGVIKGRKLTTTDTGICFFKFKKYKLNYDEYVEFLQILADFKSMSVGEIIEKLINCGPPQEGNVNIGLPR